MNIVTDVTYSSSAHSSCLFAAVGPAGGRYLDCCSSDVRRADAGSATLSASAYVVAQHRLVLRRQQVPSAVLQDQHTPVLVQLHSRLHHSQQHPASRRGPSQAVFTAKPGTSSTAVIKIKIATAVVVRWLG